jgi:molybdopterin/thiamine biosynthesis adenylyltransferase
MSDDPYDRQRRLPGIGDAGQARIEHSEARIPCGPSAAIALAYLVRAGVERATIARDDAEGFPHAGAFRFRGPLEVARGAHLASTHLLRVVRTQ